MSWINTHIKEHWMFCFVSSNSHDKAGSNPAEAVRIFQGEKILSTPSFGREVKPWVPCRRFAACKRSLN